MYWRRRRTAPSRDDEILLFKIIQTEMHSGEHKRIYIEKLI